MGQNRFRSILSHCYRDKSGSMEQILIMFHHGPRGAILWDKKPAPLQVHWNFGPTKKNVSASSLEAHYFQVIQSFTSTWFLLMKLLN